MHDDILFNIIIKVDDLDTLHSLNLINKFLNNICKIN